MSSSHQVRSTTASLLLGVAALVVVLPSAALWGTPLPAVFDSGDRPVAASPTALGETPAPAQVVAGLATVDAAADLFAQDASGATQLGAEGAPALRTEPWQSPFLLLVVLAVVVGLWSFLPVRLPRRWREHSGRPVGAEVRAACGVRAPPSIL